MQDLPGLPFLQEVFFEHAPYGAPSGAHMMSAFSPRLMAVKRGGPCSA